MTCTSTPSDRAVPTALARQSIYCTLSELLLAPDERLQASLAAGTVFDELEEALDELDDPRDLKAFVAALRAAWADTPATGAPDARTRYHRVFGHSLSPDYPPYETQYGTAHPFQQSERLADLLGFYRSFGLTISPGLRDRADHLAVELEFMGFLTAKEAFHRDSGETLHLDASRAGAKYFLEHHLGPALISFADRVSRLAPAGFYKEVSRFAAAFIRYDAGRTGIGDRLANPLELVPSDDVLAEAAFEEVHQG